MKSDRTAGAWAALAGVGSIAGLAYGIKGRSAQIFGRSVYRGRGARRSIALTFDDGPSEGTPELLDVLLAERVKATFFQCGMNARRHPAIARLVADAGHEIGNHTFSHARLCPRIGFRPNLLTTEEIYRELATTQEILRETTGVLPRLFRAPYGMRWFGVGAAQRRLRLLGVMWTVIGHDWEWPAAQIARHVLEGCGPGGIVCLHDGRDIRQGADISEMIAAVKEIVPRLKADGYAFETVSELLVPDAPV